MDKLKTIKKYFSSPFLALAVICFLLAFGSFLLAGKSVQTKKQVVQKEKTETISKTPAEQPTQGKIIKNIITPTVVFPTATPVPAGLKIQVGIDYAGQKTSDSYTTTVNQGQSAWDAVSAAVGLSNLKYTDYEKDMGKFMTGFNGINAASNQYFEFRVNGVSSNVGVSSYKCNDGDKLDFVLTSF